MTDSVLPAAPLVNEYDKLFGEFAEVNAFCREVRRVEEVCAAIKDVLETYNLPHAVWIEVEPRAVVFRLPLPTFGGAK